MYIYTHIHRTTSCLFTAAAGPIRINNEWGICIYIYIYIKVYVTMHRGNIIRIRY